MLKPIAVLAAGALAAAGCSAYYDSARRICGDPAVCFVLGIAAVAAVLSFVRPGHRYGYPYPATASDARLKTDIRPVATAENGVRLHAFRYRGSDGLFVGPLAQELQADPRFAHTVSAGADGFLRVDLEALGLEVFNAAALHAAGERAIRLALN